VAVCAGITAFPVVFNLKQSQPSADTIKAQAEVDEFKNSITVGEYIPSKSGMVVSSTSEEEPGIVLPLDTNSVSELPKNAVGYLYLDEILSAPLMQGTDNSYYLHHNAFGAVSDAGSFMLDKNATSEDAEQIVYVHTMRYAGNDNCKMFQYFKEQYQNCKGPNDMGTLSVEDLPNLYIYKEGVVEVYAPLVCYNELKSNKDEGYWKANKTESEAEAIYTSKAEEQGIELNLETDGDRYITFSTCDRVFSRSEGRKMYVYRMVASGEAE
jgi:sortase B